MTSTRVEIAHFDLPLAGSARRSGFTVRAAPEDVLDVVALPTNVMRVVLKSSRNEERCVILLVGAGQAVPTGGGWTFIRAVQSPDATICVFKAPLNAHTAPEVDPH